jgi:hypothetical protein
VKSELDALVGMAKTDYRDILAYAEYPAQMSLGLRNADESNAAAITRTIEADEKQYRAWLDRH